MDISSLYYFSELAKDLHMTHTAERLYMSQQTLSNHIQRLESYYGVALFHRKPKLSLTYAGEYVLDFAQNINREHQNLKDLLSDIKKEERGLLCFGASPLRLNAWLPGILPTFSISFPDVEIRITDTTSNYLEKASLKDFAKLPFCMLSNQLGQTIQHCFSASDMNPKIYTICSSVQISTSIGLKGVAACFATRTSLLEQRKSFPKDMNVFPLYLDGKPFVQQLYFIYHKERYLSNYCKQFMRLLSDYCKKTESISIDTL